MKYIKEQSADPEFRAEYEAEALRLALVGAREAKDSANVNSRTALEFPNLESPRWSAAQSR